MAPAVTMQALVHLEELSKEPKIQQGHRPILRIQWGHESNRAIVKKDGYK